MDKYGFTGTRNGMTHKQEVVFTSIIKAHDPEEFHHGDCIGADAEAHDIVFKECRALIVIHPPVLNKLRAFKNGKYRVLILEPLPYLERNSQIVLSTNILIATPKEMSEVRRSGTWGTIRYARKMKKKIMIIYPDGSVILENY